MRVQATKDGFYDNVLRPAGEVFDLNDGPDGEMPIRMKPRKPIREPSQPGQPLGAIIDYEPEEPWLDKDGNAVHADFAEDGEMTRGKGAFAGEMFSPGWMVEVPETVDCGIYPAGTRFASRDEPSRPVPIQRIIKPDGTPQNMPAISPSKGKIRDRAYKAAPG
jgi:hypothetical protein